MMRRKITELLYELRDSASNTWLTQIPGVDQLYRSISDLMIPKKTVFVEYDGFDLLIDPEYNKRLYKGNIPERSVRKEIHDILSPGDIAYDVGGYLGAHSLSMRRAVGKSGRVIIYEADSESSRFIEQTIDRNGFDNINVINAAVSDSEETLTLKQRNTDRGGSTGATIHPPDPDDYTDTAEVEAVPLSDEIANEEHIDLIKIDIEGAEYEGIQDIANDLDTIKTLLVELHHSNLRTEQIASICKILASKGKIYDVDSGEPLTVSEIVDSPDCKHIRWERTQDESL